MAKDKNIIVVNFKKESAAYQAFSELKEALAENSSFLRQGVLVKRDGGELDVKDEFEVDLSDMDDTLKGGLIGGLIGALAGPLGFLIGGGIGAAIGEAKDSSDYVKEYALIDHVSDCVADGETALILLAEEKNDAALAEKLNAFDVEITKFSASEMEKEVRRAVKAEEKLENKELKKYYNTKESENLLIVNYKNESDAYQAFSELKIADDYYFIKQAAIVKNDKGEYIVKDEFDTEAGTVDDTLKGGLIGSLIGALAGPLGTLLGGGIGAAIGEFKDTGDAVREFSLIDYAYKHIPYDETALILLADEKGNEALTEKLNAFEVTITRLPADKVEEELERAEAKENKPQD